MNAGQKQGMIAIGIGFVLTVIASLALSYLTSDTMSLLISAVIIFLLIAPLFGFGIYRYAKSTQEERTSLAEEMEKPRQLLDILKEKGQADIRFLSDELHSNPEEIKAMIADLTALQLFSGIVNWEDGLIAMVDPDLLQLIDICKNCQNPIEIKEATVTICTHCGTEYHRI